MFGLSDRFKKFQENDGPTKILLRIFNTSFIIHALEAVSFDNQRENSVSNLDWCTFQERDTARKELLVPKEIRQRLVFGEPRLTQISHSQLLQLLSMRVQQLLPKLLAQR
mmetsp:Transcript_35463/g.41071  ORF Transcript_35463/g.41071 Transcript_35463/m.41071 type:complete len:110 (+) Transcript_35463:208-537(+)